MDLIRAQTELALRATNEQLACHLGREVTEIRELILTILAHIEAYIDFPDEEIDPDTGSAFLARILQRCRLADDNRPRPDNSELCAELPPSLSKRPAKVRADFRSRQA